MPHSVTCGACKAAFSIPDDVWEKRVQGQVATLKCRHCRSPIEVDGRVRRGSAASINTSTDAVPAGARSDAKPAVDSPPSPAADGSRHHAAAPGPVKPAEPARQGAKAGAPKPAQPVRAPTNATHDEPRTTAVSDSGWFDVKQPQPSPTAQRVGGEHAAKPIDKGTTSEHRSGTAAPKNSLVSPTTTTAATAHTNLTGQRTAERGPTKPGLLSDASLRSTQDATPKAKQAAAPRVESKFSPGVTDVDKQRDSSDLWVVSFGADDDRELTTLQLQETMAKGQVSRDTIVWREGMTDWLPIGKIPDLAKSLKPDPVAPAANRTTATAIPDDSDEETVIFRPGTRAAAAAAAVGITPPASPTRHASTEAASGEVGGKPDVPAQRAKLVETATASRVGSPPMHAPARAAPSLVGSAQRIEGSAGSSLKSEDTHRTATTPTVAKAAFTTQKAAGGPPPLRRPQPSRPEDTAGAATQRATEPHASSMNEVVTSVPHYEPARAPAAPPPLPIKERTEAPAAKQAIFPPAVQSAPVFDVAPHSPRATPSFVPRPSDVAALTRIRPKFPKWLPFAVLGGLVVAVALLAVLSWFGGDNQENTARKAAPDTSAPLPGNSRLPGAAASSVVMAQKDAKPSGDLSAGFANQFAQAAAKQRPTARFDKEAAEKALAPGFAKAAGCHNKGEPTGTASVTISISPSGQVLSVTVAPPFSTTFTAECIRNALREISVPPFQGSPGRLAHSITIR
jgi:hypothetical protein